MNNPFDENEQSKEHKFFKQMTDAINEWMIKQYPAFDTELVGKIKELRKSQSEIHALFESYKREREAAKERHVNYITAQVEKFMAEKYPDVSNVMAMNAKNLQSMIERHEACVKGFEKRNAKVISTESLYQDVYVMRDHMMELRKKVDDFTSKLKKIFK